MINPQNDRINKMLEALEELQLDSGQMEIIEAYFTGEEGPEALDKLEFMDLSDASPDVDEKIKNQISYLMHHNQEEELRKMCEVLFAVGRSTGYNMYPVSYMMMNRNDRPPFAVEKAVSIYAEAIGYQQYWMRSNIMTNLLKAAGKNPDVLLKAIEYHRSKHDNGKLVLLAAYFLCKYPDAKPEKRGAEDSGKGLITRLFGKKGTAAAVLEEKDRKLMEDYEESVLSSTDNLFLHKLTKEQTEEITAAVIKGEITEQIRNMVKGLAVSDFLLTLLAGFSFVNFPLSHKLRNYIAFCLAVNLEDTLEIMENLDVRSDLAIRGGDFDQVFGIDTGEYIKWAAAKRHINILRVQFIQNRELYLDIYKHADYEVANYMIRAVKEQDKSVYKKLIDNGQSRLQEKAIAALVPANVQETALMKDYLRGEAPLDSLYSKEEELADTYYYNGRRERVVINDYESHYGRDDFVRRCEVLMAIRRSGYFFYDRVVDGAIINKQWVKGLFEDLQKVGMDISHQLKTVLLLEDTLYSDQWREGLYEVTTEIFYGYLKEHREETTLSFRNAEASGRHFGLLVMEKDMEGYKEEILSYTQDTSKTVKEELLKVLKEQTGWEAEVTALLQSKKAGERELAARTLMAWNRPEHTELLKQAMENEKNAKMRKLFETIFQSEETAAPRELNSVELVKELHKGGKKRGLAWAYEVPFSKVHKKSGEEAETEYLQAILLCYSSVGTPGYSKDAAALAEPLEEKELALYVNELFDRWMEAGAEAKKRWVLYAAAVHGGSDIVKKLYHQIQEWPQHARGAIAAEAVQALALSPDPQGLLTVDSIARKFKFKQVKSAAGKALEFAAAQLGLTREELADRIVPNLGFDENMERKFDYGERIFTVRITPALEIEITGEDGKKLKNMPAPGKRDDPEKAGAAYSDFKLMKKQMKDTVASQRMRLEQALSTEREWAVESWKELFVRNPVMHQFAIGLIWGVYEDRKLISCFRYMEDGSFNTEEEDEMELPPEGRIGLVHPIELTEESREAWKEQLEDYEVVQPIEQLNREIFYVKEEEKCSKSLERFGGYIINDLSLSGKLQAMGWYHGSVQDAGCFAEFYREDPELGLGVELHFSGTYIGYGNEDVTVYDARFYRVGTVARGSYVYDEANDEKSCVLGEVPERYFSEIVLQLTRALASSKERDESWKKRK